MTETTTPEPEEKPAASGDITANRRYSPGAKDKPKKLTQRQLIRKLKSESERESDLFLCQLVSENYPPCHDSIKEYLVVHGSSARNLHETLNLQMAAKAQMNGKNDPDATPRQRYAYMGMCLDITETHRQGLKEAWPKEEIKRVRNERMTRTALFNGLGTKKDRQQAKRKSA